MKNPFHEGTAVSTTTLAELPRGTSRETSICSMPQPRLEKERESQIWVSTEKNAIAGLLFSTRAAPDRPQMFPGKRETTVENRKCAPSRKPWLSHGDPPIALVCATPFRMVEAETQQDAESHDETTRCFLSSLPCGAGGRYEAAPQPCCQVSQSTTTSPCLLSDFETCTMQDWWHDENIAKLGAAEYQAQMITRCLWMRHSNPATPQRPSRWTHHDCKSVNMTPLWTRAFTHSLSRFQRHTSDRSIRRDRAPYQAKWSRPARAEHRPCKPAQD